MTVFEMALIAFVLGCLAVTVAAIILELKARSKPGYKFTGIRDFKVDLPTSREQDIYDRERKMQQDISDINTKW